MVHVPASKLGARAGTLLFADELAALLLVCLWGALADSAASPPRPRQRVTTTTTAGEHEREPLESPAAAPQHDDEPVVVHSLEDEDSSLLEMDASAADGKVQTRLRGVRLVACAGYALVVLSLALFSHARAFWPELILLRLLFAVRPFASLYSDASSETQC